MRIVTDKNPKPLLRTFFAIATLLAGCSGLNERAEKYYEAELYQDAIKIYEEVLANNPSDRDALNGISKAKRRYAEQKILQARMSRIGGNQQNSLNLLLEATNLLASPSQRIEGSVISSLEEERAGAFKYFNHTISASLNSNLPLKAFDFFQRYSSIFSQTENMATMGTIKSRIWNSGKTQCKVLKDSGRDKLGFFAAFSTSFCNVWEDQKRSPTTDEKLKESTLYGSVSISVQIGGASSLALSEIKRRLEESFRSSKWYSPLGKRQAAVKMNGRVIISNHQEPDVKVKQYTVSIPFTTQATQVINGTPVSMPRTITKNVPRSHAYSGYNHTQFLLINVSGSVNLQEGNVPLALSEKLEEVSFVHNNSVPEIGLYPEDKRVTSPDDFLANQSQLLADTMGSKLGELWKNLYCEPRNRNISLAETGEQVLRCLSAHGVEEPPNFVNIWFSKYFGLKADRATQLLGFRR